MASLGDLFNARRNNFDLVRLTLALLVAVTHGIAMRTGSQPTWGISNLGDFAVDGFFVLSGFLVTRSYLQLRSFPRFTWHRFLRIMPGFWVCLLIVAFVVAPLGAVLDGRSALTPFTEAPTAWRFVAANAGLLITQYDIAGVFGSNPTPLVMAGSLWTLVLEAACYALIGVLGLVGVLRGQRWLVPVLAGALWLAVLGQAAGLPLPIGDETARLSLMFMLGASAFVYADRVPLGLWPAALAVVVFLASVVGLENYRLIGAAPFAYALLWLAIGLPRTVRLRADLSYGTYMYHWPLQQLLVLTALGTWPTAWFVVISLCLAAAVATVSWFAIEKPSLAKKSVPFPGSRPPELSRIRQAANFGRSGR